MEQMWQLKTHGNLSFEEQDMLSAEDRSWWMDRIKKHFDEQNNQVSNTQSPNIPTPNISRPNIPSR